MMLQALGNFYMSFGAMLGGGQNLQQASRPCDKHDHKDRECDLDKRLSAIEKSISYTPSQPTTSITIHNSNKLIAG